MNEKKYVVNGVEYSLAPMTLSSWRKINSYIKQADVDQYFVVNTETGKPSIKVQELVEYLALSGKVEGFLKLILAPVYPSGVKKYFVKLKVLLCPGFDKITDDVLLEVAADFFTGKLHLLKHLLARFMMFFQSLVQSESN